VWDWEDGYNYNRLGLQAQTTLEPSTSRSVRRLVPRIFQAMGWLVVLWADFSPAYSPASAELPPGASGFSRGLLNFIILPASAPFPRVAVWTAVLISAAGLALMAAPTPSSRFRRFLWIAELAGTTFLSAVAIAPYLTSFRIVLMPRTFVLMTLLACSRALPLLGVVGERLHLASAKRAPIVAGLVAGAFFASAAWHALTQFEGNYTGFLHMSRRIADRAPMLHEPSQLWRSIVTGDEGYDGQFMYLMAFDPLLDRYKDRPQMYGTFIDLPPYRYGRIGFSALVYLVSGGRPEWFPQAMIWLLIAAHATIAAGLAVLAQREHKSPWLALWYLAIPAFMPSFLSALPEALAAAAVVVGLICWRARRDWWAALAFVGALLIRETSAVLLIALVVASGTERRRAIRLAVIAVLPLVAWRVFVAFRLYPESGSRAGFGTQYSFGVPLVGLLQLWRAGLSHAQAASEIPGALTYPWILAASAAIAGWAVVARRGTIAVAAVVYAAMAVSLNYWSVLHHLPSGERVTFELFLCLLLLRIEAPAQPRALGRALNALFVVLAVYTFTVAPDAWTSRAATGMIR